MKYLGRYSKPLLPFLLVTLMVVPSVLVIGIVSPATPSCGGQIKIAPTKAAPPHPSTLIDNGGRRLVKGSVAMFRLIGVVKEFQSVKEVNNK